MPMPYDRYRDYSLIYVWIAIIIICCLTFAGPRYVQPIFNDMQAKIELQDFETTFSNIQHPAGTEQVSLRTLKGDFDGNGQGCDFFLGAIRNYAGDKETINTTYAGQMVKDYPIQMALLNGGQISEETAVNLPESLKNLAAWELPADTSEQSLYMVYLVVLDYGKDLKLKCK